MLNMTNWVVVAQLVLVELARVRLAVGQHIMKWLAQW